MSNFTFLPTEFRTVAESAIKAEGHIMGDPRAACFQARFTLEAMVHWLYRHDASLQMPYDHKLGTLLHEPTLQNLLPEAVFQKARVIQKQGNLAVHNARPVSQYDALQVVKELHTSVTGWCGPTPPMPHGKAQPGKMDVCRNRPAGPRWYHARNSRHWRDSSPNNTRPRSNSNRNVINSTPNSRYYENNLPKFAPPANNRPTRMTIPKQRPGAT